MVSDKSMVNWRGYICHQYMCILLYVKLIWCSGIHRYMCIHLYVQHLGCHGVAQVYGQVEGEVVHLLLVDVHSFICETYWV